MAQVGHTGSGNQHKASCVSKHGELAGRRDSKPPAVCDDISPRRGERRHHIRKLGVEYHCRLGTSWSNQHLQTTR
jgi:hypothetical protein